MMKKISALIFVLSAFIFKGYSQAETYNLDSQNLHKKVRKTIQYYYLYDKESGGFVKKSVNIHRYNNEGNLIESYYLYNNKYSEAKPTKKLYNYNSKDLLVSTKDISDQRGTYSAENKYIYDRKGNIERIESLYKDGSKYVTVYENDKKGREIGYKYYNKDNKLTSESKTTYQGSKKTNFYTSYSSKDGSITGNYTTIYENDIKVKYISNGKYTSSTTSYNYDKYNNLLKSTNVGKEKTYITNYDYEYDKKGNWIKKHYRSGKYQYFYFREIYFENGSVTGSTDFDKRFVNRLGNFDNVNVVPMKKNKKS